MWHICSLGGLYCLLIFFLSGFFCPLPPFFLFEGESYSKIHTGASFLGYNDKLETGITACGWGGRNEFSLVDFICFFSLSPLFDFLRMGLLVAGHIALTWLLAKNFFLVLE